MSRGKGYAAGFPDIGFQYACTVTRCNFLVEKPQVSDDDRRSIRIVYDFFRLKGRDAFDSAKVHLSIGGTAVGGCCKLVALQSVVACEITEPFSLGLETAQSFIRAYPQLSFKVFRYAEYDIVR